jgi:hypothetical protein
MQQSQSPLSQAAPSSKRKRLISPQTSVIIMLTITSAISVTSSIYFYRQYQQTLNLIQNPQEIATQEMRSVVGKVGQLIDLPFNESPTLATVKDSQQLQESPFFQKAAVGDKVLIYAEARKAILYRPSTHKIIEIAPVNLNNEQQLSDVSGSDIEVGTQANPIPQPNTATPAPASASVSIINGTSNDNLTSTASQNISAIPGISITETFEEPQRSAQVSQVKVAKPALEQKARELAQRLNAEFAIDESIINFTDTDILIIIGSDFTQ